MKDAHGWSQPGWWDDDCGSWDMLKRHLSNAKTKQAQDNETTVVNNIYNWCKCALLLRNIPSSSVLVNLNYILNLVDLPTVNSVREISEAEFYMLARANAACNAAEMFSNIVNGQFYDNLHERVL